MSYDYPKMNLKRVMNIIQQSHRLNNLSEAIYIIMGGSSGENVLQGTIPIDIEGWNFRRQIPRMGRSVLVWKCGRSIVKT